MDKGMNDIVGKTLLFDFYGELLTDNQKKIYELHFLDDLSLAEISEQMEISRQGVFDTLKRCEHQLTHYEDQLQLVHKFRCNKTRVLEIHQLTLEILKTCQIDHQSLLGDIRKLEQLSKNMLEDL